MIRLIKHECRETMPLFWGFAAAMLLVSVLLGLACRSFLYNSLDLFDTLFLMLPVALLLSVVVLFSFIILCVRYSGTFFGPQGYLLHTLPVSKCSLLGSRLIFGLSWLALMYGIWFACAFLIVFLSGAGDALQMALSYFMDDYGYYIMAGSTGSGLLDNIAMVLSAAKTLCALFLCITVGHCLRHPILGGVLCFFGIGFAEGRISEALFLLGGYGFDILTDLIFTVLFFAVTCLLLQKKLNLD